jgi:hypothetical protein
MDPPNRIVIEVEPGKFGVIDLALLILEVTAMAFPDDTPRANALMDEACRTLLASRPESIPPAGGAATGRGKRA